MAKENLIIVGAGGHAVSLIDAIESTQVYCLIGFIDSIQPLNQKIVGYPVLGREQDLDRLVREHDAAIIVAVGDNFQRQQIAERIIAASPEIRIATVVHGSAYVSPRAQISRGSMIMAGGVINAGCKVGEGVIVNTNSSLDHESTLANFASLAPGAIVGGNSQIGERTSVGLGARVIQGLSVASDVCIGAASLINKKIDQSKCVIYGIPAKRIRARAIDEPYL